MYKKEEIKYLENTLENYYFLKRKEKAIEQQVLELDYKIENERIVIQAMQYDCTGVSGNGCSVSVAKTKSVNYLVSKQTELITQRDECKRKYISLDNDNRLNDRISKLRTESQIIINNIFQRQLTITDVAKIEKISKQTISNRLSKALEEMLKL
jgi:DNA-directed RNA polymerase specialized sigma subunit